MNDVLAQGAEPLLFLDYVAVGKNHPEVVEAIVSGVAEGCRQAGCALVGGETAEMPGMYTVGEYDIAGFTVGVVEKSKLIDGSKVAPGDLLIGIASSGEPLPPAPEVDKRVLAQIRNLIGRFGIEETDFGDCRRISLDHLFECHFIFHTPIRRTSTRKISPHPTFFNHWDIKTIY